MATLQEKLVKCGRTGCIKCPHGPYLYAAERVGNKVVWKYLGKMSREQYLARLEEAERPTPLLLFDVPASSAGEESYRLALLQIGVTEVMVTSRESLRKRVYNLICRYDSDNARCESLLGAFAAICSHKQWDAPRSVNRIPQAVKAGGA